MDCHSFQSLLNQGFDRDEYAHNRHRFNPFLIRATIAKISWHNWFQSLLNQGFDRDFGYLSQQGSGLVVSSQFQSLLNQSFDRDLASRRDSKGRPLLGSPEFQSLLNQGFDRDG